MFTKETQNLCCNWFTLSICSNSVFLKFGLYFIWHIYTQWKHFSEAEWKTYTLYLIKRWNLFLHLKACGNGGDAIASLLHMQKVPISTISLQYFFFFIKISPDKWNAQMHVPFKNESGGERLFVLWLCHVVIMKHNRNIRWRPAIGIHLIYKCMEFICINYKFAIIVNLISLIPAHC